MTKVREFWDMIHPELKENEVFIGNTRDVGNFKMRCDSLHTVRFGKQAYDFKGGILPFEYKPVFIQKSELNKFDSLAKYVKKWHAHEAIDQVSMLFNK